MSTTLEIARLRWIAVILIAVDVALTLIGQPGGFWNGSGAFKEANPFFAWFLAKGPAPFLALIVCYAAALIWLVSVLPRRLGLITLMSFVFGHYFGASSWLMYHFRLGVLAPILYGVFLSICLIALGREKNEKADPVGTDNDRAAPGRCLTSIDGQDIGKSTHSMSTNIAPKKKNPPYWLMLVAALMAVATANIITHWSDFEDGFRAGYSHAAGKQKG